LGYHPPFFQCLLGAGVDFLDTEEEESRENDTEGERQLNE
jgi:hypothetical protein